MIDVNLVTTLVSQYLRRHPDLREDQASAAVRSYLQLPPSLNLTRDLRKNTTDFNGQAFIAAMPAGVAFDAYAAGWVADIDAGRPRGTPARRRQACGPGSVRHP